MILMILLMDEVLHQLIGSLSQYSQSFIHSRWMQDFFHQQNVYTMGVKKKRMLPLAASNCMMQCTCALANGFLQQDAATNLTTIVKTYTHTEGSPVN